MNDVTENYSSSWPGEHVTKTRDIIPEPTQEKMLLRDMVKTGYGLQKLRIQIGLRVVARFKRKFGVEPQQKESELDTKGQQILKQLLIAHKNITEAIVANTKKGVTQKNFKGEDMISTFSDYALIDLYVNCHENEKTHFKRLVSLLDKFSIHTQYLQHIKGVGPAISAILIAYLDIYKAKYPSSFVQFTGLSVGPDGKAISRRSEHLVDRKYIDKKGEEKIKKSIVFNPFVQTKVLAVLGGSLIKCGNEKYSKIYNDEKFRLQHHVKYRDTTDLHRHRMALRKMLKIFMIDLHIAWSGIEGLPISRPYHEAKLGYHHGVNDREENLFPDLSDSDFF